MERDFTTTYSAILKYDENDDGTIMVHGNATDDSLDLDQQICDPAWLERAMPEWMTSGGNVREMHGNSAAGVAKEYENKNGKHIIGVHVVDPLAVKKVKTGVYKGFSVGIKAPRVVRDNKAANGRIIDGSIIEVSLVDRPANPNAKLILAKSVDGESSLVRVEEMHEYKAPLPSEIAKRQVSDEERARLADQGDAMPDGSYPIANVSDLKNAIQAFGRAKNPTAVKKHIIRRARALNAIDQLPEEWNVKKADDLISAVKALNADTVKFDQDTYDAARKAIAELIIVEASEMAEGSDETYSLSQLIEVANHLIAWYQGEVQEGEAAPLADIEMAAEPDTTEGCKCDGCMKCADAGGCDSKICKSHHVEKSAHKCLECGCDTYSDNHGRDDVSTAQIVDLSEKSAEPDPVIEAIKEVVEEATPEDSEVESSDDELKTLVAEAVKSAMEKFEAEKAALVADKDSAIEKALSLETELATALEKTVAGGPKRTATQLSQETQNEHLVKALNLKAKADASTDPILAKGYMELANDEFKLASGKTL
jgi:hypothetical protein